MSDPIDRAAEVLATEIHEAWEFQYDECDHGEYRGGHLHGERYAMCRLTAERIIRRRAAAGLLVTPAHDAAVAARALREAADRLPAFHDRDVPEWAITSAFKWLRERADRIEREGGDDV